MTVNINIAAAQANGAYFLSACQTMSSRMQSSHSVNYSKCDFQSSQPGISIIGVPSFTEGKHWLGLCIVNSHKSCNMLHL